MKKINHTENEKKLIIFTAEVEGAKVKTFKMC